MGGRFIHFYGAKVNPTWCIFLTGAALTPAYVNHSGVRWQFGGPESLVYKTDNTYSLEKPAEHVGRIYYVGAGGCRTICWTQGSCCVVIKMGFQRLASSMGH